MENATLNPIEKLSTLAAQRTARTERLHEVTRSLLAQLEKHVEVGAVAEADGYVLTLTERRSNVGRSTMWAFGARHRGGEGCDSLEADIGGKRFLNGDFNAEYTGPTRSLLIEFAARASKLVDALVASSEREVAALTAAQEQIGAAKVV